MKICMIFSDYSPGREADGIGDYTRILVETLRSRGHDVRVVTSSRYTGWDRKVVRISHGRWGIRELRKVAAYIKKGGFDAVHLQYTPVSYGFGVAFKLLPLLVRLYSRKTCFVTTFHTFVGGRWVSKVNAVLLSAFSHRIIATNDEIIYLIDKWLEAFKKKTALIPIGANIGPSDMSREEARKKLELEYGIKSGAVVMVNFGFCYPGKGIENIIKTVKNLSGRENYYIIMMGAVREQDADYRRGIQNLIRMNGLDGNFVWIPEVDSEKAADVLMGSDIFIAPYDEGISIRRGSLMAALVNGLPVVSTAPRVPMPYFKSGENVILAERGKVPGLVSAVERLSVDRDLRKKISKNARELAKHFDWDLIAEETEKVYMEGIGRRT
ncbi:MAG: glycosyltransferase [Candidatus Omnitrophica bacterium]|nr:glycosyltransferase [Candidatus Omnitrophota bacterium]